MCATVQLQFVRPTTAALLALLLGAAAGCGEPARGSVKGTVKVAGKPLPAGLITFTSESGNNDPFSAPVVDGVYELPDLPVGQAKVSIVGTLSNEAQPVGGSDRAPAPRPGKKAGVVVPTKYQNTATSGLALDVQKGENTFDADLTP